jgi:hypothetical protein
MCITSVPYHMMRDFDVVGQIGLEDTVDDYVRTLVQDVFFTSIEFCVTTRAVNA